MRESDGAPVKAAVLCDDIGDVGGFVHVLRERECPRPGRRAITQMRKIGRGIALRQEKENPKEEDGAKSDVSCAESSHDCQRAQLLVYK